VTSSFLTLWYHSLEPIGSRRRDEITKYVRDRPRFRASFYYLQRKGPGRRPGQQFLAASGPMKSIPGVLTGQLVRKECPIHSQYASIHVHGVDCREGGNPPPPQKKRGGGVNLIFAFARFTPKKGCLLFRTTALYLISIKSYIWLLWQ
jgi:hypothetical protein